MSGSIAKAVLRVVPRTFVQPVAAASTHCDPQYGAAFELRRVPPAVNFASGLTVNNISALGPPALTNPPIPGGFPAGTLVLGFPAKNPSANPNLAQDLEVDVTQAVVSTLQQNANRLVYMLVGIVEPTFAVAADGSRTLVIPQAPLPQRDCRSVFRLFLDVSTP
jgi:hypothetical protein